MKIKSIAVHTATVIISILFIVIGNGIFTDYDAESYDEAEVLKAKILSIDYVEEIPGYFEDAVNKNIYFTAKIRNGSQKGTIINGVQNIDSMLIVQEMEVSENDNILVVYSNYTESGESAWIFSGYNRVDALIFLCSAFLLLIIIIGRKKGISTIISLVLTCLIIFFVYVPSILSGFNVYLSTAVVGVFIILMSLLLVNGANKKTLCAVLGNLGGVIIAALLAHFMNSIMKMTGFIDEHYVYLTYVNSENPLNLIAIIWGGMVLGSLGAIMDVAMTIASSMHELSEHMRRKTLAKMIRSGMNIGRDAIGTMTNTLVLAYLGGSLALVLLLIVNTKNTLFLLSMEMIAVQVVQSVTGSMGILFAVPFTTIFSAYIYNASDNFSENGGRKLPPNYNYTL